MEFLEDNKADGIKLKTKQTKSNWKKALVIDGSFKRIDYHKFFYLSSAKKKKKQEQAWRGWKCMQSNGLLVT